MDDNRLVAYEEAIKLAKTELEARRSQIESLTEENHQLRSLIDSLDTHIGRWNFIRDVYHKRYPHKRTDHFKGHGVVYSAIIGNYDDIHDPIAEDDGIEYILFTNCDIPDYHGRWKIKYIDNPNCYDNTTLSRYIKMHPFELLPEYDWSVWVDGTCTIKKSFNSYIDTYSHESGMICFPHYEFKDLTDEIGALVANGKANIDELELQAKKYYSEGYESKGFLFCTGCLVRDHHDTKLEKVCSDWWDELISYTHKRDQMSFDYACWKSDYVPDISDLLYYSNPWIDITNHISYQLPN